MYFNCFDVNWSEYSTQSGSNWQLTYKHNRDVDYYWKYYYRMKFSILFGIIFSGSLDCCIESWLYSSYCTAYFTWRRWRNMSRTQFKRNIVFYSTKIPHKYLRTLTCITICISLISHIHVLYVHVHYQHNIISSSNVHVICK